MGSKGKRENLSISHLVESWLKKAKKQFLINWSLVPECQQAPRTTKDHVATDAFCKVSTGIVLMGFSVSLTTVHGFKPTQSPCHVTSLLL